MPAIVSGDGWYLESADTTGIELISQTNEAYSNNFALGGYVYEIWTFAGLKGGEYPLVFYYKRFGREMEEIETIKVFLK